MDNHLDLTIDFETCSLSANAAVMQVAAVPWLRGNDIDPFSGMAKPFVGYVDLRTCVVDGFDFDQETVAWWSRQSDAAKRAVTDGTAEPIAKVLCDLLDYIVSIVESGGQKSICIWCQGPDVDLAILRNLCRKYNINLENFIPHTRFRDCRTIILEAAVIEASRSLTGRSIRARGVAIPETIMQCPSLAYRLYEPLPELYADAGEAHNALYDCYVSSWNTWQALKWINGNEDLQMATREQRISHWLALVTAVSKATGAIGKEWLPKLNAAKGTDNGRQVLKDFLRAVATEIADHGTVDLGKNKNL